MHSHLYKDNFTHMHTFLRGEGRGGEGRGGGDGGREREGERAVYEIKRTSEKNIYGVLGILVDKFRNLVCIVVNIQPTLGRN